MRATSANGAYAAALIAEGWKNGGRTMERMMLAEWDTRDGEPPHCHTVNYHPVERQAQSPVGAVAAAQWQWLTMRPRPAESGGKR